MFDRGRMKRLFAAIVLLVVIWVTASILFMWPPICHYAGESANACMNNLRQIDGVKQQWALETGHTNGSRVTPADVAPYLKRDGLLCPSGGTYTLGVIGENPVCSLGTNTPPPGVKERVGLLGWRWKIWPSCMQSHRLPE
jgi:hypothetical protein